MGGGIAEAEPCLAGAHLVGESASPGTTITGARADAIASSQEESSGERTTLPPSLTMREAGRVSAATATCSASSRSGAGRIVMPFPCRV